MFQQLQYFIAVAECGSINRAAERLYISQQSLRSSMNSLEQKLDFPLFVRSSRGIRLTEQGQTVLEDARRILAISEGWKQFARPAVVEAETVEVLASTIICNTVLTDVVKDCRTLYPHLRIQFFHTRDDEMMATMDEHSIGVIGSAPESIITHRLRPFAQQKNLDIEIFGLDRFCIYLNSANPLADQPYLTTHDLKTLTLVAYPGEDKRFFYNSIHRYFSPSPPFFIEKQESIFQMISEMNDVAGVFPHLAIFNNRYIERGLIAALPVKNYPMPGISCMMYPKADKLTPGQKVVTMMIRRRLDALIQKLNKDLDPL